MFSVLVSCQENSDPLHSHKVVLFLAFNSVSMLRHFDICEGRTIFQMATQLSQYRFLNKKCDMDSSVTLLYNKLKYFIREGNSTPLQYSRLENPMDGGAWWAAVHGVAKSQTQLSDFTFTLHFPALKEMATHSSVLAWRIPGTAELGGLPSLGSHRVRHEWSDLAAAAKFYGFFILLHWSFL